MLLAMMIAPLVFVLIVASRPAEHARGIALLGSGVSLLLGLISWRMFIRPGGPDAIDPLAFSMDWLPSMGIRLDLGVDSVSLLMILLSCLLAPLCVLGSWTAIVKDQRTFYGWLLGLQAAIVGVFAARDLMVFYICFEFTLVPMYILISRFGSTNRRAAGTKFFLYTFTGSLIALAGLVYVVWFTAQHHGGWTLNIDRLAESARMMSATEQAWVMAAMLAGFAVKVPLFPFHTWLPLAHTEAPTAGSVILAGVLLKLGTYGIYRFVLPFTPVAVAEYAPLIATLSIIGIVYAGLICWVQTDVKKLVAYSSVSHLGFCVLGLMSLNHAGLQGSILYMINHGLSTGALFLLVGFMYERYHTRSMNELGGLAAKMPVWTCFMVFFVMASVGLPGLNGFVSEFLCMLGTFQAGGEGGQWGLTGYELPGVTWGVLGPWYALFAGTGVIIAAIYLLFLVGKICFGPLVEPVGHNDHPGPLPADLTGREIFTLMPLAVLCLVLGLYPSPVMDLLEPSVAKTVAVVQSAAAGESRNDAHIGAHSGLDAGAVIVSEVLPTVDSQTGGVR